jgi:hypothetical protein
MITRPSNSGCRAVVQMTDQLLARLVLRVRLAGEEDQHRSLRIVQQAGEPVGS